MVINIQHKLYTLGEIEVLHQQVEVDSFNQAEQLAFEYRQKLSSGQRSNYVNRVLFTEAGTRINR